MIELAGELYYEDADLDFVSPRTLRRWRAQNKLKFLTVGRKPLYRPRDIEALLIEHTAHASRK
jgi:hypothetical protein